MTVNHWVTGSSPVGGAIYIKALTFYDVRAFFIGATQGLLLKQFKHNNKLNSTLAHQPYTAQNELPRNLSTNRQKICFPNH